MSPRRPVAGLLLTAVALVGLTAPSAGDTHDEREHVRRERAAVAADLDVLEAQDAEIARAISVLEANLQAEREAVEAAEAAVAAAEARVRSARAAERRLEAEIEDLEADLRALAVQAYMGAGLTDPLGLVLSAAEPSEATQRAALAETVTVDLNDVVDRLERTRRQLAAARREAESAVARAEAARDEAASRLAALEVAERQHAELAAAVDARIEARLAEAAALASLDADLSARIQAEEADLARLNAARAPARRAPVVPAPPLRTVRGITVHADIADRLETLLAAAEADGVVLGGGGYRDSAQQWRLREANCPDPAASPASECTPPTARPGTSNHERGVAVDFTDGDGVIDSQDDPAFVWLAAYAEDYGFRNLPSEPWHWSVDGN